MEILPKLLRSSALASLLLAGTARAGGFLASGPGARATAMGGAFTGLADDASAVYFNPAGLAGQPGTIMAEHMPMSADGSGLSFRGGRLNYFSLTMPSRFGAAGFSFTQFAIGGIEARESLADAPTVIDAAQSAYVVPYAVRFGRIALGVAGKAVSYSLGRYKATGYGADLGSKITLYQGRGSEVTLGLAVRNAVRPALRLFRETAPLERREAVGIAYSGLAWPHYRKGDGHIINDRLTIAFDVARGVLAGRPDIALGAEYSYIDRYAARLGFSSPGNIAMGFGLGGRGSTFRVDYSVVLAALAPQHRFSVSYHFLKSKASQSQAARQVTEDEEFTVRKRAKALSDEALAKARRAFDERRYDEALDQVSAAAFLYPDDAGRKDFYERVAEVRRREKVSGLVLSFGKQKAAGSGTAALPVLAELLAWDTDGRQGYVREIEDLKLRMSATDYASAAEPVLEAGKAKALNLEAGGWLSEALAAVRDLEVVGSSTSLAAAAQLKDWILAKEQKNHYALVSAYDQARGGGQWAAALRAAMAMARACPDDRRAHERLAEARDKYLSGLSLNLKQKLYVRKVYYLAAISYTRKDYAEAANMLEEVLRRNAADVDGNALKEALLRQGVLREKIVTERGNIADGR